MTIWSETKISTRQPGDNQEATRQKKGAESGWNILLTCHENDTKPNLKPTTINYVYLINLMHYFNKLCCTTVECILLQKDSILEKQQWPICVEDVIGLWRLLKAKSCISITKWDWCALHIWDAYHIFKIIAYSCHCPVSYFIVIIIVLSAFSSRKQIMVYLHFRLWSVQKVKFLLLVWCL